MYEFEIFNERTNERDFIYGYNRADAFRRRPAVNPAEWTVIHAEYID